MLSLAPFTFGAECVCVNDNATFSRGMLNCFFSLAAKASTIGRRTPRLSTVNNRSGGVEPCEMAIARA